MATQSERRVTIICTGDVELHDGYPAAVNAASPAQTELLTLASGPNTITKPAGGSTVTGVTIIPPAANTTLITLKGVAGDTGIPLHKTDPTSVGIDTTESTFVLDAAAGITGVRLIWT